MSFLVVGTKKTVRQKQVSVLSGCPWSGVSLYLSLLHHLLFCHSCSLIPRLTLVRLQGMLLISFHFVFVLFCFVLFFFIFCSFLFFFLSLSLSFFLSFFFFLKMKTSQ